MQKSELRQIYLHKRQSLTIDKIQEQSIALARIFFKNIDLNKIKYLHLFLSIPEKGELDTRYIINHIQTDFPHIQLITSQTHFDTQTLSHHAFDSATIIQKNKWGVPEPQNGKPIDEQLIDMVLLPLICVDKKGNRVGYGKGHYDKFLAKCRPNVIKIGLSLFEPIEPIDDTDAWDIPLNACIYISNQEKINAELLWFGL